MIVCEMTDLGADLLMNAIEKKYTSMTQLNIAGRGMRVEENEHVDNNLSDQMKDSLFCRLKLFVPTLSV